jgi:hypothetical protein
MAKVTEILIWQKKAKNFFRNFLMSSDAGKKNDLLLGRSLEFRLSGELFFPAFDLVHQGIESFVEGGFKGLTGGLHEKVSFRNMDTDLGDFVFDRMDHIVQLQKDIHFDDAVMKLRQLGDPGPDQFDQFPICIKVHRLDVKVHRNCI